MSAPQMLADALLVEMGAAADARWWCVGIVTAYSATRATATIDGASVSEIRVVAPWVPQSGQVALFGVLRSGNAVVYYGLGDIDTLGFTGAGAPSTTLFPSLTLFPTGG
jgi:hypothetical protein